MTNRVNGSLQEKYGRFYIVLNWREVVEGKKKRKFQWINTELPIRGNKLNAKSLMREKILEKERELRFGACAYEKDMFFSTFMQEWLKAKKVDKVRPIRENTYEGYARQVKNHITPYFDKQCMKLSEIKRRNLDDFYGYLLEKGLSANTVHKIHVIIHEALAMAVDRELLYINPATEIKSIPKIKKHRADFYSRNQINQVNEAFKDDPMEAVVRLTTYYGFRRSEVLGLRWSAIDFEENLVFVNHTAIRLNRSIEYVDQCKNDSSMRIMPLGAEIKDYLLKLKEKQENDRIVCGDAYQENDYICKWFNGKPFDPSYISHHFSLILEKNGLKHLRFHELRHSSASNLISLGFSIKEVQEWLGHSTITVTADTYAHLDISSKRRISERLDGEKALASVEI